jgi:hypothetical protein
VTRVKLEFGPMKFGSQWTMYATMSDTFVRNSGDLKDYAEVVIRQLSAMIVREFKQIDFSRIKPIDVGPDPSRLPRYEVFPKEPWE